MCRSICLVIVVCITIAWNIPTHTIIWTRPVLHSIANGSILARSRRQLTWLMPFCTHRRVPPREAASLIFVRDTQSSRSRPMQYIFVWRALSLQMLLSQREWSFVTLWLLTLIDRWFFPYSRVWAIQNNDTIGKIRI